MGRYSRLGNALFEGRVSVNFVGRKYLWYSISAVILLLAVLGLSLKGLNLGIEFKGGVAFNVTVPSSQVNQAEVQKLTTAVVDSGIDGAKNPVITTAGTQAITVTTEQISNANTDRLVNLISSTERVPASQVSSDAVGASLGTQVADRALQGLIVFLILVAIAIWAYFREWKMSVAALVALAHDLLITVGVYALSGFEVTPSTVTGVLTILGYSLYDTVVVFDKIRENTRDLRRTKTTYAKAANLAVNQTLVRSINTSVMAILPVLAILVVGIVTLGSGSLKDLSLALFVGMVAGTYSSIFIATPLLVQLKSREHEVTAAEAREKARERRAADRYADVPVFDEGMPLADEPGADRGRAARERRPAETVDPDSVETRPRRAEASGSGRVVPSSGAPLGQSGASKRSQPTRKPRSQR